MSFPAEIIREFTTMENWLTSDGCVGKFCSPQKMGKKY